MALKPTIYKFSISLSDLDRGRYEDLNLTVAQHPSETVERMMVRVLAYCLNAEDGLEFTRGLSDNEEPDLWRRSLDSRILEWIEVGEPTASRIRKASRQAERVLVYSFNTKSEIWWDQVRGDVDLAAIEVFRISWEAMRTLADLIQRTMQMSVTVSGSSAFVATELGEVDVAWSRLIGA